MKTSRIFSMICLCIFVSGAALAESEYVPKKDAVFVSGLEAANEKMLARYQARYDELERDNAARPSDKTAQEMEALRYKMDALREDKSRLDNLMAEQKKAEAFAANLAAEMKRLESAPPPPPRVQAPAPEPVESIKPAEALPLKPAAPSPIPPEIMAKPPKDNAEKIGLMHSNALDYVAQKKYPEALQIYNEIILLDPEDDQAYIIMGHIYMMMNDFEKAQTSFKNAAHIDPDNIYEITPFYENMIIQNPSDDMAHAYLGYAFLILGELSRAEAAFADALNLNPQNLQAQHGLQILNQTAKREG